MSCDDYCCNHGCNQGRNCPARKTPATQRAIDEQASSSWNLVDLVVIVGAVAIIGLSGEAGEFADCIKKHWVYGQPLDKANAAEEIGDILWYCALACNALDVQLADVAAMNIEKLRKRYPARYQHDMAAFRADKQLEIQG